MYFSGKERPAGLAESLFAHLRYLLAGKYMTRGHLSGGGREQRAGSGEQERRRAEVERQRVTSRAC
jgi:hypothetical protein